MENLVAVADCLSVETESFYRDSLFRRAERDSFFGLEEDPLMTMDFYSGFERWIFPAIPEIVPPFKGLLRRVCLRRPMKDTEIRLNLRDPKPFESWEFAAISRALLQKQSREDNLLLIDGRANICYVQSTLAIHTLVAHLYRWSKVWNLYTNNLDEIEWPPGLLVFFRG